ncbi:TRAF-like family protein [Citrus sinensis]|uniref:TRAF-like family protein n=1 Tax=Citrus sinensis TaxID=2711 RepID=A0ACB8KGC5_CITSI|nr:TRAF-like family protein [Citrus sinensis]
MDSVFVNKDVLAEKAVEEKYESGAFEAGGYKWQLVLYPNGNESKNVKDHISLYLAMADKFTYFRLGNAIGKERRFNGLKLEWGFDQFIPLKAFNDASNGYLVEDTCVLGAEVENFSKLDKGRQESQVFCAGNQKWKIELHPMGTGVGAGDHLSLFLALGDSTVESVKVYAEFTLRILDQVGAKHRSFQAKYWFRRPSDGWGWPRFVSLSKLNEPGTGFLVNDACVVEAEVTVLGIFKPL